MTKDERVDSPYYVMCQVAEYQATGQPWEALLQTLEDYLKAQDAHLQTAEETPLSDTALEALALLLEGCRLLRHQNEKGLELAEQGQELWDEVLTL